jgi:hypothetical protein
VKKDIRYVRSALFGGSELRTCLMAENFLGGTALKIWKRTALIIRKKGKSIR